MSIVFLKLIINFQQIFQALILLDTNLNKRYNKNMSKYFSDVFKNYSPIKSELLNYGFCANKQNLVFEEKFFDDQFKIRVIVDNTNDVDVKIFDEFSGEEYILAYAESATGKFVGEVRLAAEQILLKIRGKCFEKTIFKWNQTQFVIDHIKKTYGSELEFLWEKFPDDSIWRRQDSKKWFGLLMKLPKSKLGIDDNSVAEVIDIRTNPEEDSPVNNKTIFEGYHMNKKSWITIVLDGSVSDQKLKELIDKSFVLAAKK